ncbi:hypothetical protein QE369_001180 [Agrobacterium larrymoorei]|uniref:Uncharacterized protein n=1 Tax=Agrobacterium larrymoorei TaxID=160699 RepID=A0AAJ2B9S1_9HYPH|nr:hypothetical protein [Agrobacterium larrymoorei]MDR6101002.1 hypothetical protein [Agrobacterium larrymoorei]
MSEAFLRKIATVVDLVVVRTSTLSALHRTVRANDPEITKFWKRPDASEWRDLRTHPQYGPVAQWLWDVEGRSCELKYELVAEFGGDWSLLGLLLCDELSRRRMG